MLAFFEIQLVAVIISVACAVLGVFLVLNKMSMMTDAITHTLLLGIVLAFFVVKDLNSPVLLVGATVMGVLTVWLTQSLAFVDLVSEDSAIGIVFPFLFSIAIILISKYASNIHLDVDAVLLGEIIFIPFDRLVVFGVDIGAKSIYISSIVLVLNLIYLKLFFKELKLVSFDPVLAVTLGFSPVLIHYSLMTMVSLTAVTAFEAVGSVLVIAFMIVPANIACFFTDDLKTMVLLSGLFGGISGVIGFKIAILLDVSVAGTVAVVIGIMFLLAFIFAPNKGLISQKNLQGKQRKDLVYLCLLLYLNKKTHGVSCIFDRVSIQKNFKLSDKSFESAVENLLAKEFAVERNRILYITDKGQSFINDHVFP